MPTQQTPKSGNAESVKHIKELTTVGNWGVLADLATFQRKDHSMLIIDSLFENKRFKELNSIIRERSIEIEVGGIFIPVSESTELVKYTLNKFARTGNIDKVDADTVATFQHVEELDTHLKELQRVQPE